MATRTLGRRPTLWPFRLFGWLFLLVLVLGLMAVVAVLGSGIYYEQTRTTAGDVEGMIEAELHNASSTDQLIRFLDRHRIEHGAVGPVDAEDPRLKDADVPDGATAISGIIRNDGYSLELVDVRMTFILDAEGTLEDWVVYEVHR